MQDRNEGYLCLQWEMCFYRMMWDTCEMIGSAACCPLSFRGIKLLYVTKLRLQCRYIAWIHDVTRAFYVRSCESCLVSWQCWNFFPQPFYPTANDAANNTLLATAVYGSSNAFNLSDSMYAYGLAVITSSTSSSRKSRIFLLLYVLWAFLTSAKCIWHTGIFCNCHASALFASWALFLSLATCAEWEPYTAVAISVVSK